MPGVALGVLELGRALTPFGAGADTPPVPSRNLVYEALVLRARESPAGDRVLTLMTAEAGLVDVFVFGGPKSKLRSVASPYASGRAFVYLDPVKDFRKLSDFEVRDSFPALREDLGRLWGAGLIAELLIKTSGGGGDFPLVLELGRDALFSLDAERPERADYPTALFLWRLVALLGLGPDPISCATCGRDLLQESQAQRSSAYPGRSCAYSAAIEGFLCPSCAARAEADQGRDREDYAIFPGGSARGTGSVVLLHLGDGVLRWLTRSESLTFREAVRTGLDERSISELKALTFGLARRAAETPLSSFAPGVLRS